MSDSGQVTAYRVRIAGIQHCFVTDPRLEGTDADGHVYVTGLLADSLNISESVDLPYMEYKSGGMDVAVMDRQSDHVVGKALYKAYGNKTQITAEASVSATSITVQNASIFSVGDYVWLGQECLKVTSASGTTLGVSRAELGTIAHKHHVEDAAGNELRPYVYDAPPGIEGRPVEVYQYVLGRDSFSAGAQGTRIFRGRAVTDAGQSFEEGVPVWQFTVDPIYSVFKQEIGTSLDLTTGPRGIYYPDSSPFYVSIAEATGTGSANRKVLRFRMSGFWETQDAFITHLDTVINAFGLSGFTVIDSVSPFALQSRWSFLVTTKSSFAGDAAIQAWMWSPVDGRLEVNRSLVTGSELYWAQEVEGGPSGARQVPRGCLGLFELDAPDSTLDALGPFELSRKDGQPWPPHRLYVAGDATQADGNLMEFELADQDDPKRIVPNATDGTDDWVNVKFTTKYTPGSPLKFTIRKLYGEGKALAVFRDALVNDSPDEAGTGNMPLLSSDDLADWSDPMDDISASHAVARNRVYSSTSGMKVEDMLIPEFRLFGVFPATDSSGALRLRRLEIPSASLVPDVTLSGGDVIGPGGGADYPSSERFNQGVINTVVYRTGYDPFEDEHTGAEVNVSNQESRAEHGKTIALDVEPIAFSSNASASYDQYVDLATPIITTFGNSYYVTRFFVPDRLYSSMLLGTVVSLTNDQVINPITGTPGVSGLIGIVTKRDWRPVDGTVEVSMLSSGEAVYGFTPTVYVSSSTHISGNTYDFTVTTTEPYASFNLFPSGLGIEDAFQVNDELALYEIDPAGVGVTGAYSASFEGTVLSVTGTGQSGVVIRVELDSFGGSPLPAADYFLQFPSAPSANSRQELYAYVADPDGTVEFPGTPAGSGLNWRGYGV